MFELSWRSEGSWLLFTATENKRPVGVDLWQAIANPGLRGPLSELWMLLADDRALADEFELHVTHGDIIALSPAVQRALSLPPPAPVTLSIRHLGTIDQDAFGLALTWYSTGGRALMTPSRDGAFLTVAGKLTLLPDTLFAVAEAVDAFNRVDTKRLDDRADAYARVQSLIASEETGSDVAATGYLRELRIAHAHAFSLQPYNDASGEFGFRPVLFSSAQPPTDEFSEEVDEPSPLLPPARAEVFADQRFVSRPDIRGKHALGDGWILVLSPPLRAALSIARKAQMAGGETARDFVRNPRAYLRAELGEALDDHLIEGLFRETGDYSARVAGLGLWVKKVLPWVQQPREPWLPPERVGLSIGGALLDVDPGSVPSLLAAVDAAIAANEPAVFFNGTEIPANPETVEALKTIAAAMPAKIDAAPVAKDPKPVVDREVLLIKNNFDEVVFTSEPEPRASAATSESYRGLLGQLSEPKSHQVDGIDWLQRCWLFGWRGALLADDMGLGKTFQTLAFLAWLKAGMRDGSIERLPVLIVAPTGLLRNWEKEHDIHLAQPGLGRVVRLYGDDLRRLIRREVGTDGLTRIRLETEELSKADWLLTTYETLRDHQTSLGRLRFAALVFDEAQKIKTPGTQVTDAAKGMNAEFTLALTGTPIENRLADLWCIIDTVQPKLLGSLKEFSTKYENEPDPADLAWLKDALTGDQTARPSLMLRRMKADALAALPDRSEILIERDMPKAQADAYASAVQKIRSSGYQGAMLEGIQRLRRISLSPITRADAGDDDQWIASSARLLATFEALDQIAERDEKVLLFVEFRDMQAELAGVIQRRYRLPRTPQIISGDVAGPARQARVDNFQAGAFGFNALILSPKAGGVGLTLTAANNVIHVTRWWNPAVEDQSTDRCYRIGQTKAVTVYLPTALYPTAPDSSFDRRLAKLLADKRQLSRELLAPPAGTEADARRLYDEVLG